MPTFRVTFKRTMTWEADVCIDASTDEAAEQQALQNWYDGDVDGLDWFDDDESVEVIDVTED